MEWKMVGAIQPLLGDTHGLALTLAGAGVGAGALSANGKTTLEADSAVAVDGGEALHLSLLLTTKVTLDEDSFVLDHGGNLDELLFAQLAGADVRVDTSMVEDFGSRGGADSKDIRKRSLNPLLIGDVCAEESCHDLKCSEIPAKKPSRSRAGRSSVSEIPIVARGIRQFPRIV